MGLYLPRAPVSLPVSGLPGHPPWLFLPLWLSCLQIHQESELRDRDISKLYCNAPCLSSPLQNGVSNASAEELENLGEMSRDP